MASKKGVIVTVAVLSAITLASFVVWLIPQNNEAVFSTSNFENHLNGVKAIHGVIGENLEVEFQKLLDGKITPDEYIQSAESSSTQINSQTIQLVESGASEDWHESYIHYINALKQFNTYIRETIVIANLLKDGNTVLELEEALQKTNQLKIDSLETVKASDMARP